MKPPRTKPTRSAFDGLNPAAQDRLLKAIFEDDSDQKATTGLIKLIVWTGIAILIIAAVVMVAILI